jgi:hypothetical protein
MMKMNKRGFQQKREKFVVSKHAALRVAERGLPSELLEIALYFGAEQAVRGARILRIDKASVIRAAACGIDIATYLGACLICNSSTVITAYRRT